MKVKSVTEILVHELQDLYSAEKQILKSLPEIIEAVSDPAMKESLQQHQEETKKQAERLVEAYQILKGSKIRAQHCKGMEGVLEEGSEALKTADPGELLDLAIANACLRVEHYEVAGYTGALAMAKQLGLTEVADLLSQTLEEETKAGKAVLKAAAAPMKAAPSGAEEEPRAEDDDEASGEEEDDEDDEDEEDEDGSEEDESAENSKDKSGGSAKKTSPAKQPAAPKKKATARK